jgi:hypothetical protein
MKQPPSQREVEHELNLQFKYGDFEDLARELDRDPDYIRKLFNPNNPEKRSSWYQALRELAAMRRTRHGLAVDVFTVFDRFARQILFNGDKASTGLQDKELRDAIFDLVGTEIHKLPYSERLRAVQRARLEIEKFEQALMSMDLDDSDVSVESDRAS